MCNNREEMAAVVVEERNEVWETAAHCHVEANQTIRRKISFILQQS